MTNMATNFLDFLESIYGRAAVDQIIKSSGMDRDEVTKASDAFVPAFLDSLIEARSKSHTSHSDPEGDMPSFGNFWPKEMVDGMQTFLQQSVEAAKSMSDSPKQSDVEGFPFSLYAQQKDAMDNLYQVFMGQMAQAKLMDDVSRATGIAPNQLKSLFPMLTTYGLMPMMPQMAAPSMDDPAGWVDYLGDMSRKGFKQANRDLDAMPSPLHAAFEGLMAGLYPPSPEAEKPQEAPSPDKAQDVRDATLELQANYIKGLNTLFEQYANGVQQGQSKATKDDDRG